MSQNQLPTPPWPGWSTTALLGRGGFGAVYRIERDNFGSVERAAMKVITIPQNDSDIQELYTDGYTAESVSDRYTEHMKSIVHEYSMMAKLKGSANVVYCDDVYQQQHADGIGWDIFIRMELLTPLPMTLSADYNEAEAVRLGTDLANALRVCQEHKIIHRDIKPQNIFVSADGTCKLGDFGIAKITERTTSGTKTGTYKYMAPEVYHAEPYGSAADVYSLGMVLYWLMNERRGPFMPLPPQLPTHGQEEQARSRRFAGEPLPEPRHGSDELKALVLRCCSHNPAARPNIKALYDELRLLQLKQLLGNGIEDLPNLGTELERPAVPEQEDDEATIPPRGWSVAADLHDDPTIPPRPSTEAKADLPAEENRNLEMQPEELTANPAPEKMAELHAGAKRAKPANPQPAPTQATAAYAEAQSKIETSEDSGQTDEEPDLWGFLGYAAGVVLAGLTIAVLIMIF